MAQIRLLDTLACLWDARQPTNDNGFFFFFSSLIQTEQSNFGAQLICMFPCFDLSFFCCCVICLYIIPKIFDSSAAKSTRKRTTRICRFLWRNRTASVNKTVNSDPYFCLRGKERGAAGVGGGGSKERDRFEQICRRNFSNCKSLKSWHEIPNRKDRPVCFNSPPSLPLHLQLPWLPWFKLCNTRKKEGQNIMSERKKDRNTDRNKSTRQQTYLPR